MCFSKLFARAERKPGDPQNNEAERRLSITMPMAGVGAELDGEHHLTETEQDLKKAGWLPAGNHQKVLERARPRHDAAST
jgi:hypothetical protein